MEPRFGGFAGLDSISIRRPGCAQEPIQLDSSDLLARPRQEVCDVEHAVQVLEVCGFTFVADEPDIALAMEDSHRCGFEASGRRSTALLRRRQRQRQQHQRRLA